MCDFSSEIALRELCLLLEINSYMISVTAYREMATTENNLTIHCH